jgi:hypothetical protein
LLHSEQLLASITSRLPLFAFGDLLYCCHIKHLNKHEVERLPAEIGTDRADTTSHVEKLRALRAIAKGIRSLDADRESPVSAPHRQKNRRWPTPGARAERAVPT